MVKWLSIGVGMNVNNTVPSGKATSSAEITGRHLSRRVILEKILEEAEKIKKSFSPRAVYSQGSHALAEKWNSYADCIGAKAVIFEPDENNEYDKAKQGKILSRGIFEGIDPAGRCILKTEKGNLYFNQGSVSLAFINP